MNGIKHNIIVSLISGVVISLIFSIAYIGFLSIISLLGHTSGMSALVWIPVALIIAGFTSLSSLWPIFKISKKILNRNLPEFNEKKYRKYFIRLIPLSILSSWLLFGLIGQLVSLIID